MNRSIKIKEMSYNEVYPYFQKQFLRNIQRSMKYTWIFILEVQICLFYHKKNDAD